MSLVDIQQGSIETILVDVEDVLENLVNLVTAGTTFTVKDDEGVEKMSDVAVTIDVPFPLRAKCVIDTTLGGLWDPGKYRLYLTFNLSPDTPILYAGEFSVNP